MRRSALVTLIGSAFCSVAIAQGSIAPREAASTSTVDIVRGNWSLHQWVDKMTDQEMCSISYIKSQGVWIDKDERLVVSYSGRGGVSGYQYRIGNRPATRFKIADSIDIPASEKDLGDASRILVSGLTVFDTLINEDIDLTGLREARVLMRERCQGAK